MYIYIYIYIYIYTYMCIRPREVAAPRRAERDSIRRLRIRTSEGLTATQADSYTANFRTKNL